MKLNTVLLASTIAQQSQREFDDNDTDVGFAYESSFEVNYDYLSGFDAFNFQSTAAPSVIVITDSTVLSFDDSDNDEGNLDPIRPHSIENQVKSNFVVDTGAGIAESNLFGDTSIGEGSSTNEVQDFSTIDIQLSNGANAQRCFVGSASSKNIKPSRMINQAGTVADWFTNGNWDICEGENDTCEIKVVRRNDIIQQIHSKCANRHSCVDNMRQNFNPQAASPSGETIYSSWIHQACRPRWDSNGAGTWNARQQSRDSVCFFCIEPCREAFVWRGDAQNANQMRQAECVGRSASSVWNAAPIKGSSMKIFEDCSDVSMSYTPWAATAFSECDKIIESDFGQTLWDESTPRNHNDGSGPDMKKFNYYSVIDNVMLYNTEKYSNHPISLTQDVSRIQYAQIIARDNDFMTDAVDPSNLPEELSVICHESPFGDYCYSDDVSNNIQYNYNLYNVFNGGTYSRSASGIIDDFVIDIEFDTPRKVYEVRMKKVLGANGGSDYADLYKNICMVLTMQTGTSPLIRCTNEHYGFSNSIYPSSDNAPYLGFYTDIFPAAWETPNVLKVQLFFDTSETGSDPYGANAADYAVHNAIQFQDLGVIQLE